MNQTEVLTMLHNIVADNQQYTTWTVSTPHLVMLVEKVREQARQEELAACCDLLEGMHVASTGSHNYYLHAANELRRFRKGEDHGKR